MPCALATSPASQSAWNTYYGQGEEALAQQKPEAAEQDFRKALNLVQNTAHASADTEKCMLKLAETLVLRNELAEALTLYQKLLGILQKRYGTNGVGTVPVLMALGSIQESLGDHGAAITYYQKALNINQKNYGPYSPAFAENLHMLGRAKAKAGQKQEAAKNYKQALDILQNEPSLSASGKLESLMHDYSDLIKSNDNSDASLIEDFKTDISPGNLKGSADAAAAARPIESSLETGAIGGKADSSATVPIQNQADSKALSPPLKQLNPNESAWRKQADIQLGASRQSQLNEDPEVALRGMPEPFSDSSLKPAYKVINDSIVQQGRYQHGEDYYRRMIAVDINALGPAHPSVANDLNGLAQFYINQQKYVQAEPLLTRAYAIYEQVYGLNNLLTVNTCASLALVEFHLGNIDKAASLYKSALSHGESAAGPNTFETARILNELAYLYFHQGKLEESCTFYQWALASTGGAFGQDNPLYAACLKDYANVLRSLGRLSEAMAMESRADNIMAKAK